MNSGREPMVIDFHAHVYEDGKAPRIMADMRRRGVAPSSDGTLGGLLASMDRAGVGLSVVSRITVKPEQAPPVNEWLLSLRSPRILPLATIHPGVAGVGDQVEELRARGFSGFKVHPDYQRFVVEDRRCFPFYEAAEAAGMWVLIHAGLDRGLPDFPVNATPRGLLTVHEAFPRLRLVAAHMGGEEIYEETERTLLGRDVYLDTSFVLRKMPLETFRRLVSRHPAERLLFGSDTPWSDQVEDLRFFLGLPFLSAETKEKMTWGNARELFGKFELTTDN
ncbi:MAG: amidohydrolase family protein [Deltaproteobacteria bacterium]|nr:amidohydrolase family protein [Deltaproteobacteria bacterium]